jgi:hypothetical protein
MYKNKVKYSFSCFSRDILKILMATCIYTPFLSYKTSSKTCAIEVGHTTLRVIKPDMGRSGVDVKFTEEYKVSSDLLDEGVPQKEVLFGQELSKIQRVVQSKQVVFVLPTHLFMQIPLQVVCEKGKDLTNSVLQVLSGILKNESRVLVFDYKVDAHTKHTHTYTLTAFVLESDVYARFARATTLAKMSLLGVLPLSETVTNLDNIHPSFYLYLGSEWTELIHVYKNPLTHFFEKKIITYSLGGNFIRTFEKSEEYLKKAGTGIGIGDHTLFDLYTRMYAPVVAEIRMLLENSPTDSLYLSGPEATMLGVRELFARELEMDVVVANPLIGIFSFEKAVPKIHHDKAVACAAGIGVFRR